MGKWISSKAQGFVGLLRIKKIGLIGLGGDGAIAGPGEDCRQAGGLGAVEHVELGRGIQLKRRNPAEQLEFGLGGTAAEDRRGGDMHFFAQFLEFRWGRWGEKLQALELLGVEKGFEDDEMDVARLLQGTLQEGRIAAGIVEGRQQGQFAMALCLAAAKSITEVARPMRMTVQRSDQGTILTPRLSASFRKALGALMAARGGSQGGKQEQDGQQQLPRSSLEQQQEGQPPGD